MFDPPTHNRLFADKREKVGMDGVPNKFGDHSYVTRCKNQIFHKKVRGIFMTLISLDRFKAIQNQTFLYFWGEIAFEDVLFFEKEA